MLLCGVLTLGAVRAAPITRTFVFSASDFDGIGGADPVTGSVTVTWDKAVDVFDATDGITLNALGVPLGSAIGFSYVAATDEMAIGGMDGGVGMLSSFTDDISVVFTNASGDPAGGDLFVSAVDSPAILHAGLDTISVAAPEPASLALLAAGAVGLGWVRRRQRRTNAPHRRQ